MTGISGFTTVVAILTLIIQTAPSDVTVPDTELDAFWAEMARTVVEGAFEEYAALYHADAILVSGPSESSYPIAQALEGWEQGFVDTRAGKTEASVEFVFTQRLNDTSTAHETGIFHYTAKTSDGEGTESFVHFEALLIKKGGEWKMMMEYQKSVATIEEWTAAN